MKECWVCGLMVEPNKRRMNCVHCQGAVITPEEPTKRKQGENYEELMKADAHKKVRGRIRQTHHGR